MAETGSPFHRGEQAIQERLGVRDRIEAQVRRMIGDRFGRPFGNGVRIGLGGSDPGGIP